MSSTRKKGSESVKPITEDEALDEGSLSEYLPTSNSDCCEKIKKLILLVSHINSRNGYGLTPLHHVITMMKESIEENNKIYSDIFILLLEYGENPNIKNDLGYTPFALACYYGLEELVFFMVNKSLVDINIQNLHGYTPLHSAILSGNLKIVKHLLKNNAEVHVKTNNNENALHILCNEASIQSIDIAKLLMMYGVDVNAVDDSGNTPLVYAISIKNKELQKLLIEYGATVEGLKHYIYSPHAVYEDTDFFHKINKKEMKKYYDLFNRHAADSCQYMTEFNISDKGIDNIVKGGNRAIYVLTYNNVPAAMMRFDFFSFRDFKSKIDIEFLCANKDLFKGAGTVAYIHLYNFARTKNPKIEIKSFPTSDGFFRKQNMLSTTGNDIETIYYVTVTENDPPKLSYNEPQIILGGNKNNFPKNGSPSFMLGGGGHFSKSFVVEDDDVNGVVDENGNTPLLIACKKGRLKKMKELIAKGADVNKSNKYGNTPLQIALKNKDKKMKELLLRHGAIIEEVKHYIYSPNSTAMKFTYFINQNYFESIDKEQYIKLYENVPNDFEKKCEIREMFDVERPSNSFCGNDCIYILTYANVPASFMRIHRETIVKGETKIIISAFCTSNTIFKGAGALAYRHLYNFLKTKLVTINLTSSSEGMKFYDKLKMRNPYGTDYDFQSVVGVDAPKPISPEYPKLLGGKTKNKKPRKRKTRKRFF